MSLLRYSLSFMSYKGVKVLDIFIHTLSYWELHPIVVRIVIGWY